MHHQPFPGWIARKVHMRNFRICPLHHHDLFPNPNQKSRGWRGWQRNPQPTKKPAAKKTAPARAKKPQAAKKPSAAKAAAAKAAANKKRMNDTDDDDDGDGDDDSDDGAKKRTTPTRKRKATATQGDRSKTDPRSLAKKSK